MSCNQFGCENHFHVTCGQAEGLLCVKRGYSGPDTYFGYCPLHRIQLVNYYFTIIRSDEFYHLFYARKWEAKR